MNDSYKILSMQTFDNQYTLCTKLSIYTSKYISLLIFSSTTFYYIISYNT